MAEGDAIAIIIYSKSCKRNYHMVYDSVRTNSKYWNKPNTEHLFDSKNWTNRIPSNYLFPKNYLSSIQIPQTIRIVRKFE